MIIFKKKVMTIMCGRKKGKVTGGWIKLHKNDIYDFPPLNIIRAMKLRSTYIRDAPGMLH